ncbi:hypothetical protein CH305_06145 [Rhodococcus sp. 15-649-2-2]|uniref:hypothetical protein n=1 Tax=Rhodococcus sp. 15-649-2-2 TaxID=2023140 RepID=UPI000B9BA581|nr:hypothetical protein [Rhodococcus sp. 15-649-2-2]OZE84019.1 hypothetical protein CH305_06145 [Rhodococcus sp. 15-649-2-2]
MSVAGFGRLRDRTAVSSIGVTADDGAREAVDTALQDRLRPLIVRVTGRTGVGKSAILAILESVRLDADGLDVRVREDSVTDNTDFDVLVYVIAGAVSPVDTAFLSSPPGGAQDGTVVVLTKADTLDDPTAAAAAASHQLARTVLPVMGATAAGLGGTGLRGMGRSGVSLVMADVRAVAASEVGPADLLTVERFLAADITVSTRRREALIECIELRGVALLIDVLRQRTAVSDGDALRELADATGVDAVLAAVSTAVSVAAARRDAHLHRSLQQIGARHRQLRGAVESYLASDEAVAAEMRCAALHLGLPIETGSEQVVVEQAALWKQRAAAAGDSGVRRSALALCRGYVRMLRR